MGAAGPRPSNSTLVNNPRRTSEQRPPHPIAAHTFHCDACGEEAGAIQLYGSTSDAELIRKSFVSTLSMRVSPDSFLTIEEAVRAGDIRALYAYDFEVASFFCPKCDKNYCAKHWTRWDVFEADGWHDCIRGICPAGHDRMLED